MIRFETKVARVEKAQAIIRLIKWRKTLRGFAGVSPLAGMFWGFGLNIMLQTALF